MVQQQSQLALFSTPVLLPKTAPGGFMYREDFLSEAEHADLLRVFQTLPFKNDDYNGYTARRRIIGFGRRNAMPDFLQPARSRAEQFAGLPTGSLGSALISEYSPGTPIGWHRDKPTIGHVVGVSLAGPCRFCLRKVDYNKPTRDWERFEVTAEPRSIYVMANQSRRDWQHGIPAVPSLRYSITFRDF